MEITKLCVYICIDGDGERVDFRERVGRWYGAGRLSEKDPLWDVVYQR